MAWHDRFGRSPPSVGPKESRCGTKTQGVSSSSIMLQTSRPSTNGPSANVEIVMILIAAAVACFLMLHANLPLFGEAFATADLASDSLRVVRAREFGQFTGTWSVLLFEHPGAFHYYWRALFEWLLHDALGLTTPYQADFVAHVALIVGALAIPAIGIARWAPGAFMGLICFATSVAYFSASFVYFTTMWLPFASIIPFYACILSCSFGAAGSPQHWPMAALFGAIASGMHLSLVIPVAVAIVSAVVLLFVLGTGSARELIRGYWLSLLLALACGLVVIAPSIVDVVLHSPDNVDRILLFLDRPTVELSGAQIQMLLAPLTAEPLDRHGESIAMIGSVLIVFALIHPRDWLGGRDGSAALAAAVIASLVFLGFRWSLGSIRGYVPTHAGAFLITLVPLILFCFLYFFAQPSRRTDGRSRSLVALGGAIALLGWAYTQGDWTNAHLSEGSYMNGMERQGVMSAFGDYMLEITQPGDRIKISYEADPSEPNRIAVGLADFLVRHDRSFCVTDSEFDRLMFAAEGSCLADDFEIEIATVPVETCGNRCASIAGGFGIVVSRPTGAPLRGSESHVWTPRASSVRHGHIPRSTSGR